MVPSVSCRELLMRLGDEDVLVIDCREDEEWRQAEVKITGALRISARELTEAHAVLPDDELIVLYDGDATGRVSTRAWEILQATHPRAVCLSGGIRAWMDSGGPVEPAHGDFEGKSVY